MEEFGGEKKPKAKPPSSDSMVVPGDSGLPKSSLSSDAHGDGSSRTRRTTSIDNSIGRALNLFKVLLFGFYSYSYYLIRSCLEPLCTSNDAKVFVHRTYVMCYIDEGDKSLQQCLVLQCSTANGRGQGV